MHKKNEINHYIENALVDIVVHKRHCLALVGLQLRTSANPSLPYDPRDFLGFSTLTIEIGLSHILPKNVTQTLSPTGFYPNHQDTITAKLSSERSNQSPKQRSDKTPQGAHKVQEIS
jgi:hypothetical protein